MIQHCVWVRFRPEVSAQQKSALFEEIRALVGQVPGMRQVRHGVNARFEDLDHGFMDGFIAEFDNRQALQAYQDHPLHRETGRKLVACAQGGLQGLLVFDLASA